MPLIYFINSNWNNFIPEITLYFLSLNLSTKHSFIERKYQRDERERYVSVTIFPLVDNFIAVPIPFFLFTIALRN